MRRRWRLYNRAYARVRGRSTRSYGVGKERQVNESEWLRRIRSEEVYQMRMSVSPRDWGLEPSTEKASDALIPLGMDKEDLERRCRENTYGWLFRQFNEEIGAFCGYYDPWSKTFNEPQTANLIAPFQLIATFDRYEDEQLLHTAQRACEWLHEHMVETHPMSFVLGGVRDNLKPTQLWTKYTADYVMLNLALYDRTGDEVCLDRAIQSGRFLLQAQNHDFAPKYDHRIEQWMPKGWQSFGRVVVAMLALYDIAEDKEWMNWAVAWAEYGAKLQAPDGCFYLVNDDYYNSDVVADEMRALVRMYRRTGRRIFLDAALRFADWHVDHQRRNGSWWLSVDRYGTTVGDFVGPGDVPNIAISLMMMHRMTGEIKYLASAVRALRYSLCVQATPDSGAPYLNDPNVVWGFWSWDPYYDYTLSSDQSTHHVRGYLFFLDYFLSLPEEVQQALVEYDQAAVTPLLQVNKAI